MMKVTTTHERGHAFAVQNAVAPAGAFVGSLAAGVLPAGFHSLLGTPTDGAIPYGLAILVGAVVLAPSVAVVLLAGEPPDDDQLPAARRQAGGGAPLALMTLVAVVLLLVALGDGPVTIYYNTYLDEVLHAPTTLIGGMMAAGRLVAIPAALTAPLMIARWGHARAYAATTVAAALSLLPLVFVPRWEAAAVSFVAMLAFVGIGSPAMVVFHQSLVPRRRRHHRPRRLPDPVPPSRRLHGRGRLRLLAALLPPPSRAARGRRSSIVGTQRP